MHKESIYDNPVIDNPIFLFVQVTETTIEKHCNDRTCHVIEYRVQPLIPEHGGSYLLSQIFETNKAAKVWKHCRGTFHFDGYDVASAIGRWGKIYLVPSRWQQCQYSTVQYVAQTDVDRAKVAQLEHLTSLEAIPWDAKDEDEAAEIVEAAMSESA